MLKALKYIWISESFIKEAINLFAYIGWQFLKYCFKIVLINLQIWVNGGGTSMLGGIIFVFTGLIGLSFQEEEDTSFENRFSPLLNISDLLLNTFFSPSGVKISSEILGKTLVNFI